MTNKKSQNRLENESLIEEMAKNKPDLMDGYNSAENSLSLKIDFMGLRANPVHIDSNGRTFFSKLGKMLNKKTPNRRHYILSDPNPELDSLLNIVSQYGKEINYVKHVGEIFSINPNSKGEINDTVDYNFKHFYNRAKRGIYDVNTLKTDALRETTVKKGREFFSVMEGKGKNDFPSSYVRKVKFDLGRIFGE